MADENKPNRPLLQFSIRSCLVLTGFVACLASIWAYYVDDIAAVVVLFLVLILLTMSVIGIIYGRDNTRTFSIGAILPLAVFLWLNIDEFKSIPTSIDNMSDLLQGWYYFGGTSLAREGIIMIGASFVCGTIATIFAHFLTRDRRS
jgi:hypothetical protein